MTYGVGNIGTRTIESFVDQFGEGIASNEQFTVQEIATRLRDFMQGFYTEQFGNLQPVQQPVIGFYVAGYSTAGDDRIGSDWEFSLPNGEVRRPRVQEFGASWRGIAGPFGRLYSGVDQRIFEILRTSGVAPEVIEQVRVQASQIAIPVVFDGMPLQDAVGFCKFIIDTTVGTSTYEVGVPSCGGPVNIAVITRKEGFRIVRGPTFSLGNRTENEE